MTDTDIYQHYRTQRAPALALPRALQTFAERRKNAVRPHFLGAVLAGVLVLASGLGLWAVRSDLDEPAVPGGYASTTAGLAQLRTPPRPTMPSLASLSLPSDPVAMPRFNQINLNIVKPEET